MTTWNARHAHRSWTLRRHSHTGVESHETSIKLNLQGIGVIVLLSGCSRQTKPDNNALAVGLGWVFSVLPAPVAFVLRPIAMV